MASVEKAFSFMSSFYILVGAFVLSVELHRGYFFLIDVQNFLYFGSLQCLQYVKMFPALNAISFHL